MTTYYEVLEVSEEASIDEIKRSYRRLALKYHPDKNPSGGEQFRLLSEAFFVLSDPTKKREYDASLNQSSSSFQYSNNIFKNAKDVFDSFMSALKGLDIVFPVECSLEELYSGTNKKLIGNKLVSSSSEYTINVGPGMRNNETLVYDGQGHQNLEKERGNLIFRIRQLDHQNYTRDKDDLIRTVNITLTESLCGFTRTIETLDGRILKFSWIPTSDFPRNDTVKVIRNEGMPRYMGSQTNRSLNKGILKIKFNVIYPTSINKSVTPELRIELKRCLDQFIVYPDSSSLARLLISDENYSCEQVELI
ncbi:hypothetical protein Ciccas_006109 [Cichlidogyrus casuarinus]|uniref:J domain-containing protein n=1 Tax=Cichlidogyrus casuarinus TaxID=1844966 RepID=A0ABD2Q6R2_9PLAT